MHATAARRSPARLPVRVFLMSKCPFAARGMARLTELMADFTPHVDLRLEYIAFDRGGKLRSLHGAGEVAGDRLQLCVQEQHPVSTLLAFVACQNRDFRAIPRGWEACAREVGIDAAALRSCAEGERGRELLRVSLLRAQVAGAQGSPTFLLGKKRVDGAQPRRVLLRALCAQMPEGVVPAPCAKLPPEVAVQGVILTDRRCKECTMGTLPKRLKERFLPGLTLRTVDYSSQEGKRIYGEAGLRYLPVVLLGSKVKRAAAFPQLLRWTEAAGPWMRLRTRARFDPTAEICDNHEDDTGNGKVDCADPTCRKTLRCRPEKKRHLQVFVMSHCPFAARGMLAVAQVLKHFKGRVTFEPHVIATAGDRGTFDSLHGQAEVEEDIRQLCAVKHYRRGARFLRYLTCRYKNPRSSNWKACARGPVKARVIERCANGSEGKALLRKDIHLAEALEIRASPTWLANNRHKFSAITAEQIKTELCGQNPGLKGCEDTLSTGNNVPADGSCGGR